MSCVSSPCVHSGQSFAGQDPARLFCCFQASGVRQAAGMSAELRAMAAGSVRVSAAPPRLAGQPDWIVTLTTPTMPLALDVLQRWETAMLAVEHRWPGCRFLGWRTWDRPPASKEPKDWLEVDAAVADERSQRGLVTASLLRCPIADRGGTFRARAVAR